MKNIHILPTDKPSRLLQSLKVMELLDKEWLSPIGNFNRNIYITNDEEIKEGDWCIHSELQDLYFKDNNSIEYPEFKKYYKKIILTTDQELIKDGVQAIDDEFLEWFIKNPSCESVEVELIDTFKKTNEIYVDEITGGNYYEIIKKYKIIIPKEPKETLEEVIVIKRTELYDSILSIVKKIPRKEVEGDVIDAPSCAYELEQLFLKWQQERSYSEKEVIDIAKQAFVLGKDFGLIGTFKEWFDTVKKK